VYIDFKIYFEVYKKKERKKRRERKGKEKKGKEYIKQEKNLKK